MAGILYGIGVGPGNPELLTLKAVKAMAVCDVFAVPDSGGEQQIALDIAREYVAYKQVLSLDLPMTHDRAELLRKRELAADEICARLDAGKNVGFLTLGDPMVYSTYSYLHRIIVSREYEARIIPAVTSFCAAAAALGEPLCEGSDALHIIPALYGDMENALKLDGTKVLMKSGSKLDQALETVSKSNQQAFIAQRVGMEGQRLLRYPAEDVSNNIESDYFSIVIVKK